MPKRDLSSSFISLFLSLKYSSRLYASSSKGWDRHWLIWSIHLSVATCEAKYLQCLARVVFKSKIQSFLPIFWHLHKSLRSDKFLSKRYRLRKGYLCWSVCKNNPVHSQPQSSSIKPPGNSVQSICDTGSGLDSVWGSPRSTTSCNPRSRNFWSFAKNLQNFFKHTCIDLQNSCKINRKTCKNLSKLASFMQKKCKKTIF